MRVVVAPDKFKGSLTAVEAAEAIGEGLRQGRPGVDVVLAPVADGGDGTVDAAVAAGYDRVTTTVAGPTGEPVTASFAVSGDTAVVEMAEAAGLRRLPGGRPAPLTATTYGDGRADTGRAGPGRQAGRTRRRRECDHRRRHGDGPCVGRAISRRRGS